MRFQYLLVLLFAAIPMAGFAAAPVPEKAYFYKIRWGGFHVASVIAGFEKEGNTYHSQAVIRTYGLARSASRYSSESQAKTLVLEAGVKPMQFHTAFSMRKSSREIFLGWDDAVNIIRHKVTPPEKPGKRTPVSEAQKSNAFDPLSAYFAARAEVVKGSKKFTIPMFDGRRRSELQFEVLETRKEDGALHVTMREIFIAGFTGREQEERAHRNLTIHIYLDPKTLIPISCVGDSIIGRADGELAAECDSFDECIEKD